MAQSFLKKIIYNHVLFYPTPISLNFFWNFGFISGVFLGIQILSGVFLAAHYCSDISLAFTSVEYIMREVNSGWLLRYVHANGASFFLLAVYIHMARGIYYKSYLGKKKYVWFTGVLIFLCLMAIAFLGYVLPWGQMSFWGATVITNLVSALPYVGKFITNWLWGGYAVNGATLSRFFMLHFILPFVLLGLVFIHVALLHEVGSFSSVLFGLESVDFVPFYPYFFLKDFFVLNCYFIVFSYFVFFEPNALGHPDNYIRADSLVTPPHIVPEWYFLPFYAILRCVPNKAGGIVLMFSAIFVLFFLPIFVNKTESAYPRTVIGSEYSKEMVLYDLMFFTQVVVFVLLGWIGSQPIAKPFVIIGPHLAAYYYFFFLCQMFFK